MSSLECDLPALENLFPLLTMIHIHTDYTCGWTYTHCVWDERSGTRSFFNWLKGPGLPSPYFFCLWGSHISGSLFFAAKALTEIMLPSVGFATSLISLTKPEKWIRKGVEGKRKGGWINHLQHSRIKPKQNLLHPIKMGYWAIKAKEWVSMWMKKQEVAARRRRWGDPPRPRAPQ